MRQIHFQKTAWSHRFSYGGSLRQTRRGRCERPLSTREPIHLVFKANTDRIAGGFRTPRRFRLLHEISRRYSVRFFIKIEMISIQSDHVHVVVQISRRSLFQNFLRVFSGQVAQRFEQRGSLTTRALRAYRLLQKYVQLNEIEAQGRIPYRKERLRGLSTGEWELLNA